MKFQTLTNTKTKLKLKMATKTTLVGTHVFLWKLMARVYFILYIQHTVLLFVHVC